MHNGAECLEHPSVNSQSTSLTSSFMHLSLLYKPITVWFTFTIKTILQRKEFVTRNDTAHIIHIRERMALVHQPYTTFQLVNAFWLLFSQEMFHQLFFNVCCIFSLFSICCRPSTYLIYLFILFFYLFLPKLLFNITERA